MFFPEGIWTTIYSPEIRNQWLVKEITLPMSSLVNQRDQWVCLKNHGWRLLTRWWVMLAAVSVKTLDHCIRLMTAVIRVSCPVFRQLNQGVSSPTTNSCYCLYNLGVHCSRMLPGSCKSHEFPEFYEFSSIQ